MIFAFALTPLLHLLCRLAFLCHSEPDKNCQHVDGSNGGKGKDKFCSSLQDLSLTNIQPNNGQTSNDVVQTNSFPAEAPTACKANNELTLIPISLAAIR